MVQPWSYEFVGRVDEHVVGSEVLEGNPLGDPHERPLWVYVPPGYDDEPGRRYPSVYVLQGYTGHVAMWRNRMPFRRPFPEVADELIAEGGCPPCIVVYVDAWSGYGGSQYVDSPGTGRYHTYLCDEVVAFVDARYRTLAGPEHRGIVGKSSGGYGAMITPMLRPDLFGGLATHAGDALFESCYLPWFPRVVRALRDSYEGSYERFWDDFRSRAPMSRSDDDDLVETYGVAACYSADDDGTVRLPFDLATGRLVPEVWDRWLAWDPVRMVERHADALRGMRAIYIDAGRSDDFNLDLGAEAMRRELAAIGVDDVHFELFDGTHFGIDHRYPLSLRHLADRLSP
jgi:S-formylglutathione hydrolase FrmB